VDWTGRVRGGYRGEGVGEEAVDGGARG